MQYFSNVFALFTVSKDTATLGIWGSREFESSTPMIGVIRGFHSNNGMILTLTQYFLTL